MKLFALDALDIPWLILCDSDRAIHDCLKHAVDLGILAPPREVTDIESRRTELEQKNIFFYPARRDFELYMLEEGFLPEYEEAIAEVFHPRALDGWINRTLNNKPQWKTEPRESLVDKFVHARGRKPELASLVAMKITSDSTDPSRIPPYFHRVIDTAVNIVRLEVLKASGGDPSGQS